jgi:hypothetical protein
MEAARPSIIASQPNPDDPGLMVGFGQFFTEGDDQGNADLRINAGAAQYDLDHRWWPAHREAVLALVEAAERVAFETSVGNPGDNDWRLINALRIIVADHFADDFKDA